MSRFLHSLASLFPDLGCRMGEGHRNPGRELLEHEGNAASEMPSSEVLNPLTRRSEAVTYTSPLGFITHQFPFSCGHVGIYFQLATSENRFFFTLSCQRQRASAFRPFSWLFFRHCKLSNLILVSLSVSRRRIFGSKPRTLRTPISLNDGLGSVQTSPWAVSVL